MVKWVLFVRRRAGLTPAQFRDHYETVHAPLAMRLLPIRRYVRNYLLPTPGMPDPPYDVMTEFWFDSAEEAAAARAWYAADESQTLQRDEMTFMDRDSMIMYDAEERESPPAP